MSGKRVLPNMGHLQGKVRFPPPSPPDAGVVREQFRGFIRAPVSWVSRLPRHCRLCGGRCASVYRQPIAIGWRDRKIRHAASLSVPPDKVSASLPVSCMRTGFRASFSSENLLKVDGRFIREGRKAGAAITDRIFRSRDGGQVVAASPFVALKKNSAKTFCSAAVRRHAGSSL